MAEILFFIFNWSTEWKKICNISLFDKYNILQKKKFKKIILSFLGDSRKTEDMLPFNQPIYNDNKGKSKALDYHQQIMV